jgi:hypothetical protein
VNAVRTSTLAINDFNFTVEYVSLFRWSLITPFILNYEFRNSGLTLIPFCIVRPWIQSLDMSGSPLIPLHAEMAKLPLNEMLKRIQHKMSGATKTIDEIKLMVVGEAAAGKTSLLYKLKEMKKVVESSTGM